MDDRRISIDELRQLQRDNWPEMYAASKTPLLRLARYGSYLTRDVEKSLRTVDLMPAEFDVLATLRRQPPPHALTPTHLCRALLMSSGGLTKMLNRLQSRDLISRPTNPDDGRSLLVRLTGAGKRRAESALDLLADLHRRQLAALTETEQAILDQLLDKLLTTAEQRDNIVAGYRSAVRISAPD